jgi:hypothetical protein
MSSASTAGNLYWKNFTVDDVTRTVSTVVSYYVADGAESITNDGVVKVLAVCQRQSDNAFIVSPQGQSAGGVGTGLAGSGFGTRDLTPADGYTFVASDRGQSILFDSGTSVTITLPDTTTPGFEDFYCYVQVDAPGDLTINTVTQLINGSPSFFVAGTNAFTLTITGTLDGYETI